MFEQVGGLGVDLERVLVVEQIEIEPVVRHLVIVIQTDTRLSGQSVVDDNFDDNRDDSYSLSVDIYSPKSLLSCLVTAPARSWQCGVMGAVSSAPYPPYRLGCVLLTLKMGPVRPVRPAQRLASDVSPQPEKRQVSLASAGVGAVHHLRAHAMGSEH